MRCLHREDPTAENCKTCEGKSASLSLCETEYQQADSDVWIKPVMSGYKMKCCDCGLVHEIDFRVLEMLEEHPDGSRTVSTVESGYEVEIRARRLAKEEKILQIELGHGDKLITDIYDEDGEWAGFAISDGHCSIGDIAETGADRVADLEPIVTIITHNPKSLDVIIQACERAIKSLGR
jgi:hypothetical protein